MRIPRSRWIVVGFLALGGVSVASCGGSSPGGSASTSPSGLPFPPHATEPATSPAGGPKPAGQVITIGGRPEGLAVDPATGTLGVALRNAGHEFERLDATTLTRRTSVRLPGVSRHVSLGDGGRFLVPIESTNQLAIVPPRGGHIPLFQVGEGPHAATAAGGAVFVADELGGTITRIRAGRAPKTVPVDVQPGGIVDVGGGKVAVVSVRAYTVELLDTKTLRPGGSQNAGYGPSHAVADSQGRVFIADTRGGNVLEYATRPRLKFTARLHLGGSPYGLAIDPRRSVLWVTRTDTNELYEVAIDGGGLRVIKRFATVRQPNTVAVDVRSGAAIVASETDGQLQRVLSTG